jgi:hypothetical protein
MHRALSLIAACLPLAAERPPLELFYAQPAAEWTEALPAPGRSYRLSGESKLQ